MAGEIEPVGHTVAILGLHEPIYLLVFIITNLISAFYITRGRIHGSSIQKSLTDCICVVNEREGGSSRGTLIYPRWRFKCVLFPLYRLIIRNIKRG